MSASIGFAVHEGVGYLKLAGDLRHDIAGPLEVLIERWFEAPQGAIRAAVIDLNEAQFMDSTVIGLVAAIARELLARTLPAPTVFSTNVEINQLLASLRLDEVFTVVQQSTSGTPVDVPVLLLKPDAQCSAEAILKAHETLIELNEANRIAFQPVVDLLRSELL
jgi:anti-anti-sigma factor